MTMSVNDRGGPTATTEEIMMIQETLRVLHLYDGEVDGHAGPHTYRAVRAFKKSRHMRADNALDEEFVTYVREHTWVNIDPSTEKVCATISLGGEADTNAAVAAAKEAFNSWSQSSKSDRLDLMNRILDVYNKRSDEMGETISREMGAPVSMSKMAQSGSGSAHIKAFIKALETFDFDRDLRADTPKDQLLYEPIGVCGLITPWNWPMNQIALKVMPAIATGCTMILKPSELSPLSGILFAEILHEAGVPAGVFNLVNGDGPGVGTQLSGHPDIALISFTGSSRAGIAITKNAADTLKRVSLELGGKGANIVFADAPAEAIAQGVARCFNNTGQSCNAPTRMLVERSRYEQAVEEAAAQAAATAVDLASKEGKHIGPLVSEMQYNKVSGRA